jgi:hypothetical protein
MPSARKFGGNVTTGMDRSTGPWMIPVSSLRSAATAIAGAVGSAGAGGSAGISVALPGPGQLPGLLPPSVLPIRSEPDTLSSILYSLNTNPYLIGALMLLLNLGGRFLSLELTPKQEEFLRQRWLRPLIFFTVIFVATRNIAVAVWVTVLFFVIIWVLANEKSPFCLIPSWKQTASVTNPVANVNTPTVPVTLQSDRYDNNISIIQKMNSSGSGAT